MTPHLASARFILVLLGSLCVWSGCAASPKRAAATPATAPAPAPAPAAAQRSAEAANGFSDVNTDKALDTRGHVRAWTGALLATASRFRKELYGLDGYVVSERIDYEDKLRVREPKLPNRAPKQERGHAIFQVAVPIEKLPALLDWLRLHATIVEQYVVATRDGRLPDPAVQAAQAQKRAQLEQRLAAVEQRLAALEQDQTPASEEERATLEAQRQALRNALARMQAQSAGAGVPAVRFARLDVRFETELPQARFAAARIVPSVRASLLVTDVLAQGDGQGGAREARVGAAIGVGLTAPGRGGLVPSPIVEIAGYPATADRGAGVTVTLGGAVYARSMGGGERTWLNPFAGLRLGYAHLGAHAFAVGGELGVEILKTSGIAWSASMRPYGFIGKDSQVSLETGTSLSIAF